MNVFFDASEELRSVGQPFLWVIGEKTKLAETLACLFNIEMEVILYCLVTILIGSLRDSICFFEPMPKFSNVREGIGNCRILYNSI